MKPYYSDSWLTVYEGDCREVMASMEPESVHCVVTSPPYWGLRDYGTATWVGGDVEHAHEGAQQRTAPPGTAKQASNFGALSVRSGDCTCGAIRQDSQLGLEPTPEEYVANMVAVFREVRRVLRSDGTVWLNLGDSYANTGGMTGGTSSKDGGAARKARMFDGGYRPLSDGLKPKDLVGIPWRVAFALQADGWYLRSDIIWAKPNPMPESVTDRPTKAHEYLFLLAKSERYYFDADAVAQTRDPAQVEWRGRYGETVGAWGARREAALGRPEANNGLASQPNGPTRNIRSVWTVATQPYPGAHFATFPEKLVEPCIKAGTSERGVCPECGAPWARVVERQNESTYARIQREHGITYKDMKAEAAANGITPGNVGGTHAPGRRGASYESPDNRTTGWRPGCAHELDPIGAVVLDPFAGSGTVGRVAQRLSRRAVLIDLNADYLVQAMARNADIPLGLETA